ncbi:hypothetical protein JW935_10795 [candidate division KSB1 bacterium]|nr:hypothetical protein [candidate division KSB1 bacterium]
MSRSQIGKLQQMPWQDYYQLATNASRNFKGQTNSGRRRGFSPVVDGHYLPQHPYYPEPTPEAADVPMMICSTMNEMSPSRDNAELENVTLEQVVEKVRERAGFRAGLGDKAPEVVKAYAKAFPGKRPVEIRSLISSNRQGTVALADAKSKQVPPV